jgi:hypothetical protein
VASTGMPQLGMGSLRGTVTSVIMIICNQELLYPSMWLRLQSKVTGAVRCAYNRRVGTKLAAVQERLRHDYKLMGASFLS